MRDACDVARLSAFLDDELDEQRAIEVAQHAASCSTCTGELDAVRTMRDALRSLPAVAAPSPDLFAQAIASADVVFERRRRLVLSAAGAGGLTALLAATVWLAGADADGTVVPPMDRFIADHVGRVDHGPLVTPVEFGR